MTIKSIKKDIEISKKGFFLLYLLWNALIFLLAPQVELIGLLLYKGVVDIYLFGYFVLGILFGLIASILFLDKIVRPMKTIRNIISIALPIFFLQAILIYIEVYLICEILFLINSALIVLGLMLFLKIFIIKTSLLERGRILSIFTVLMLCGNLFVVLAVHFILVQINFILIVLIVFNKYLKDVDFELKTTQLIHKNVEEKKDYIKYYIFFAFFSFTASYSMPLFTILEMMILSLEGELFLFIFTIFITEIILTLFFGYIFDRYGRVSALIFIVIAIAVATYLGILPFEELYLSLSVGMSAYFTGIIAIPLIIGDVSPEGKMGKRLSVSYLILGVGLVGGAASRLILPDLFNEPSRIDIVVSTTILICCIACLIYIYFLLDIRERISSKEQKWKSYLMHLYIIQESGLLIYEKSYKKRTGNTPPLIISGGIIGLITILKTISGDESNIKVIDQENKKLMFRLNFPENAVYVLIVKEDLFIFRKKLDTLIEEIDNRFGDEISKSISIGLHHSKFDGLEDIVKKHFG